MNSIQEIYNNYLAKEREERRINERIIDRELQIKRLEKKKSNLGGWISNVLIPLADVLLPLLDCETYEILGPFGLRGETSVWFKKANSTEKYCDYSLNVTVHNEFEEYTPYKGQYCSSVMKSVCLYYDTYERDNSYQRGSIGELNGFNKIEAPLPDSIDEIVKIIKATKEK